MLKPVKLNLINYNIKLKDEEIEKWLNILRYFKKYWYIDIDDVIGKEHSLRKYENGYLIVCRKFYKSENKWIELFFYTKDLEIVYFTDIIDDTDFNNVIIQYDDGNKMNLKAMIDSQTTEVIPC